MEHGLERNRRDHSAAQSVWDPRGEGATNKSIRTLLECPDPRHYWREQGREGGTCSTHFDAFVNDASSQEQKAFLRPIAFCRGYGNSTIDVSFRHRG